MIDFLPTEWPSKFLLGGVEVEVNNESINLYQTTMSVLARLHYYYKGLVIVICGKALISLIIASTFNQ